MYFVEGRADDKTKIKNADVSTGALIKVAIHGQLPGHKCFVEDCDSIWEELEDVAEFAGSSVLVKLRPSQQGHGSPSHPTSLYPCMVPSLLECV